MTQVSVNERIPPTEPVYELSAPLTLRQAAILEIVLLYCDGSALDPLYRALRAHAAVLEEARSLHWATGVKLTPQPTNKYEEVP